LWHKLIVMINLSMINLSSIVQYVIRWTYVCKTVCYRARVDSLQITRLVSRVESVRTVPPGFRTVLVRATRATSCLNACLAKGRGTRCELWVAEPDEVRPCSAASQPAWRWPSAAPLFETQIWGCAEAQDGRHELVVAGGAVRRGQGPGGVRGDARGRSERRA
jgi:hypothetical protein